MKTRRQPDSSPTIDLAWLDAGKGGRRSRRDQGLDAVWALALRARDFAKRKGFLGRLDDISAAIAEALIPPPSHEIQVRLPGGLAMTVPPGFPSARSYAANLYEPDITHLFRQIVRPGDTVVDAGANIGYYTLLAAQSVGAGGRVYAFEPDPRNYEYLLRNIGANGLSNVRPVPKALSNRSGEASFVLDRYGARSRLGDAGDHKQGARVEVTTLDDFFRDKTPAIDLVKMDIEGAEMQALEGMRQVISANPRLRLILEVAEQNLRHARISRQDMAWCLAELGFRRGYIIQRGLRAFSLPAGFPEGSENYDILLELTEREAAQEAPAGASDE